MWLGVGNYRHHARRFYIVLLVLACARLVAGQWDFKPQWDTDDNSEEEVLDREKRQTGYFQFRRGPNDGLCPWYQWDEIPACPPDSAFECYKPPYYPYDEIHIDIPNIGKLVGRSMSYAENRFINIFQGVPYARAPTNLNDLRFKPPQDIGPRWDIDQAHWCADRYRDACPQELWHLQDKFYEARNMTEDCLHLNIFAPNISVRTTNPKYQNYDVLVFVHGTDFKWGDSMLYPGHILARKEVLVVTFNYRLGAFGFLSTLDSHSPGNYGLWDIIKVLEFIQKYIRLFGGNPKRVTLVGHGSGAAAISLLLLSPAANQSTFNGLPLFHQAVLMAGTDLCEWATVQDVWNANAQTYARDLGLAAGCGTTEQDLPNQYLVECLREKSFEDIVNASASVYKRYGSLAGPFGPVVDGKLLPDTPEKLRENKKFMRMKIITGVTSDEGAYFANNVTKDLSGVNMNDGLDPKVFRELLYKMVRDRAAIRNIDETVDAIEFEYTYWAKPDNRSAVRQNLVDMWSDQVYGWCMDALLKHHACDYIDAPSVESCPPVYMYQFAHRSEYESLPQWMGIPNHKDVDYLFGHPFFNESLGNITGIIPEQWDWTYLDRNISEYIQDMWVNFTKYSNPTIEYSRNVTWWPFSLRNLSYIKITEFSYMEINYRQNHYAFWREFYPSVSSLWPITTTPQPTPHPLVEYQYATWSLVGAAIVALFVLVALGITLWRRSKAETELY